MIKGLLLKQNINIDSPKIVSVCGNYSRLPKNTQNTLNKSLKASGCNKSSEQPNVKTRNTEIDINTLDDNSKDNEGLIMDVDDEPPVKKEKPENIMETDEGNYFRKICNTNFQVVFSNY